MSVTVVTKELATIMYDGVEIGVLNIDFGDEQEEIEAHTTKADHYEGGRVTRPITFSILKDVTVPDLALNTEKQISIKFEDSAGNDVTYSGMMKLFNRHRKGNVDQYLEIEYTGKFTGNISEVQAP